MSPLELQLRTADEDIILAHNAEVLLMNTTYTRSLGICLLSGAISIEVSSGEHNTHAQD